MFPLLLLPLAAHGACPASLRVTDLNAALAAAEKAYVEGTGQMFPKASAEVTSVLPCVTEPIPPDAVARLHRIMGLRAFAVDRDRFRAGLAFAAARALEPKKELPAEVAPPGSPVAELYGSLTLTLPATEPLPTPAEGDLRLDGKGGTRRHAYLPVVLQVVEKGQATLSAYVWADQPVPDYASSQSGTVEGTFHPAGLVVGLVSAALVGAGAAAVADGVEEWETWQCTGMSTAESNHPSRCPVGFWQMTGGGAGVAVGAVGLGVSGLSWRFGRRGPGGP